MEQCATRDENSPPYLQQSPVASRGGRLSWRFALARRVEPLSAGAKTSHRHDRITDTGCKKSRLARDIEQSRDQPFEVKSSGLASRKVSRYFFRGQTKVMGNGKGLVPIGFPLPESTSEISNFVPVTVPNASCKISFSNESRHFLAKWWGRHNYNRHVRSTSISREMGVTPSCNRYVRSGSLHEMVGW